MNSDSGTPALFFSGPVLVVADLFHPVGAFTVEPFHNGDVGHGRGRRGAVPMLLAGRKPDHVAWPDFLLGTAPSLRPPETRCDDQFLTEWMRVPCGAGTRLEC